MKDKEYDLDMKFKKTYGCFSDNQDLLLIFHFPQRIIEYNSSLNNSAETTQPVCCVIYIETTSQFLSSLSSLPRSLSLHSFALTHHITSFSSFSSSFPSRSPSIPLNRWQFLYFPPPTFSFLWSLRISQGLLLWAEECNAQL